MAKVAAAVVRAAAAALPAAVLLLPGLLQEAAAAGGAAPSLRTGAAPASGEESMGRRLSECATTEPLLWKVKRGTGKSFYVVGTYHTSATYMMPPDAAVTQAIGCTDRAFFNLACAGTDSGMGGYMTHCSFYPPSVKLDALSMRLNASTIANLKVALNNILDQAPAECAATAAQFRPLVSRLGDLDFRMALYPLYESIVQVLSPNICGVDPANTYDDWVRAQFPATSRPVFGLEDVEDQCLTLHDYSVVEDLELASLITTVYGKSDSLANTAAAKKTVADVIKCGDLTALTQKQLAYRALPYLLTKVIKNRNNAIFAGMELALEAYPTETLAFVVGALHMPDLTAQQGGVDTTATGLPNLLAENGYTVERVAAGTDLQCTASSHTDQSASQLGLCLAPPYMAQPESCLKFTTVETKRIAEQSSDGLYGRHKDLTACSICSSGEGPCQCKVTWTNTSGFEKLCHTPVDGEVGVVREMDMTRNPGSIHVNADLSEKTIMGISQECYAESCNVQFLEKMALRNWYKSYPSLVEGKAVLREVSSLGTLGGGGDAVLKEHSSSAGSSVASGSGASSDSSGTSSDSDSDSSGDIAEWQWLLLSLLLVSLLALCAVCIIMFCCSKQKRRPKRTREAHYEEREEEGYEDMRPMLDRQERPPPQAVQYQAQPVQMTAQAPVMTVPAVQPQYIERAGPPMVVPPSPTYRMVSAPQPAQEVYTAQQPYVVQTTGQPMAMAYPAPAGPSPRYATTNAPTITYQQQPYL